MRSDIFLVFRSRWLLSIIFVSFLLRFVIFSKVLPQYPTNLAPDEGTYGLLSAHIAKKLPANEFPLFGDGLYLSARALILPSAALFRLGFSGLESVRIVSSVYGILSTLALALCFVAINRLKQSQTPYESMDRNKTFIILIAIYSFVPSHFLWSTLALRESAITFWLTCSFYFIIKVLSYHKKFAFYLYLPILFCMTMAAGARKETAYVFSFALLLVHLIFMFRQRFRYNVSVGSVVLVLSLSYVSGSFFTTSIRPPLLAESSNNLETKTQTLGSSSLSKIENSTKKLIDRVTNIEEKRNANRVDANSALPESNCGKQQTSLIERLFCNASEFPYRLFSFLLRPFPVIDSGTSLQRIAGFENFIWLILIILTISCAVGLKTKNLERLISNCMITFILVYSSAAALYEGNLGTAFRHKSAILWPCTIVIYVYLNSRSNLMISRWRKFDKQ